MNEPVERRVRRYRGELGRVNFEPTGRVFRLSAPIIHRLLRLFTRVQWRGGEALPKTGPAIVVANHISSLDPVLVGEFLIYHGRWPHFLARADLFDGPILGPLLRAAEQIPVHRGTTRAADALKAAEQALARGQLVVIYPEGTITLDPQEWPMAGHTGAARLALRTGVPVLPLGQWGASFVLPPRRSRPFRLRRHQIRMILGARIDLSEFIGREPDRGGARQATVRIMDAITAMTEQARQATAPRDRWLPAKGRRVPRDAALH